MQKPKRMYKHLEILAFLKKEKLPTNENGQDKIYVQSNTPVVNTSEFGEEYISLDVTNRNNQIPSDRRKVHVFKKQQPFLYEAIQWLNIDSEPHLPGAIMKIPVKPYYMGEKRLNKTTVAFIVLGSESFDVAMRKALARQNKELDERRLNENLLVQKFMEPKKA